MRVPGGGHTRRDERFFVAGEDASRLADNAVGLVEQAVGVTWYERQGNAADLAALTLCRLRRARAGEKGGHQHGDDAVRLALGEVSPHALVWLASRAISYMDESGFPEAVESWFPDEPIGV